MGCGRPVASWYPLPARQWPAAGTQGTPTHAHRRRQDARARGAAERAVRVVVQQHGRAHGLPGRDRLRGRHGRLGRVLRPAALNAAVVAAFRPHLVGADPLASRSHLDAPLQPVPRPGPARAHHHRALRRRRGAVGHQGQALRRADPRADGRAGAHARCAPTPPAPTGAAPPIRSATSSTR